MKFGGFHFIHPAANVYLQIDRLPDTETVKVTVKVDNRHTFTGTSEIEMFTIGWARDKILDLVPIEKKFELFFYAPMMRYKDGKIGPEQLKVEIMTRMELWPESQIETVMVELNKVIDKKENG